MTTAAPSLFVARNARVDREGCPVCERLTLEADGERVVLTGAGAAGIADAITISISVLTAVKRKQVKRVFDPLRGVLESGKVGMLEDRDVSGADARNACGLSDALRTQTAAACGMGGASAKASWR